VVLLWGSSAVVVPRSLARYEGILVLDGLPVVELESEGMTPVEWSILAEICSRPDLWFEMKETVVLENDFEHALLHLHRWELVMKICCVIGVQLSLLLAGREQTLFVADRV